MKCILCVTSLRRTFWLFVLGNETLVCGLEWLHFKDSFSDSFIFFSFVENREKIWRGRKQNYFCPLLLDLSFSWDWDGALSGCGSSAGGQTWRQVAALAVRQTIEAAEESVRGAATRSTGTYFAPELSCAGCSCRKPPTPFRLWHAHTLSNGHALTRTLSLSHTHSLFLSQTRTHLGTQSLSPSLTH